MASLALHPALDHGIKKGSDKFAGGTLVCKCTQNPVVLSVESPVLHNHACGCTKCWKPQGAMFSVVGVVPTDKVKVIENKDKLSVVDPSALIQRHACKECKAHLYGPVEKDHAFKGLSFIHPELFKQEGAAAPGFAAFVSSVIESGVAPSKMASIRSRLRELNLEPYDCLNPTLMDMISTFVAKKNGTLSAEA